MSWRDIEDAMQQAVVEASRLAADKVYWSYQDRNEQIDNYAVITFGGGISVGQDYITSTTDLTRPQGQEILRQVNGTREVPFQIEVFTNATDGDGASRHIAELIRGRFRLDSIRRKVRRANVSPFDSSPVGYVPDIIAAKFRGRSVVTLRCYVPLIDCYEYVGYVARIRGTYYPIGLVAASGATGYGIPFDSLQASGASGYQYRP